MADIWYEPVEVFFETQIEIFSKIKCENIFFQIDAYFDLSMYVCFILVSVKLNTRM